MDGKISNTTAKVIGGRDLMTKPNIDTKGMFGDNKRREGRIWGLRPKPSPMDKFVVKDLQVHGASEEASYTDDRRTQRGKGWVGEVDGRTHPEGRGKEQEEEKSMLESKERTWDPASTTKLASKKKAGASDPGKELLAPKGWLAGNMEKPRLEVDGRIHSGDKSGAL